MNSENFSSIAKKYEESSIIQKSAADILFLLLCIRSFESVLDVGCGTGNITKRIYDMTKGKTVGVDASEGMIKECWDEFGNTAIQFYMMKAEDIPYKNEFDVIFCNSTFQWFHDVDKVLSNFYHALRKGGRVGIQAPATKEYCPNFLAAIDEVAKGSLTIKYFNDFKSPWLFFDTSEEYSQCFTKYNFHVVFSKIQTIETVHSREETYRIFASGAITGYLNKEYYTNGFDEKYSHEFKRIVKDAFAKQADNSGMVKLKFNRIFLIAEKK